MGRLPTSAAGRKKYYRPICEFGETLLFNYSSGVPTKTTNSWDYGIWLGRCTQSDEHFVTTGDKIYRTRSVRRLPLCDRYNKELILKAVAAPWTTRGIGRAST